MKTRGFYPFEKANNRFLLYLVSEHPVQQMVPYCAKYRPNRAIPPIWVRSRKMRGRSRKSYSIGGAPLGNQYLATSRCTYKHNFCIARPSFNNLDPLLPPPEKWHINGYTLKYSTEQTVRSLVITTAQEYNFSLAPTNITLSDLLSQNSNLL